jgi:hypothetical protein
VAAAVQVLQSVLGLVEFKGAINDGSDFVLVEESQHLLESRLGAVEDTLQGHVSAEREHVGVGAVAGVIFLAGQVADAVDETSEGDGVEGLSEGASTAVLENHVNALVVGHLESFFGPVWRSLVVDGLIRAESLCLLKLLV